MGNNVLYCVRTIPAYALLMWTEVNCFYFGPKPEMFFMKPVSVTGKLERKRQIKFNVKKRYNQIIQKLKEFFLFNSILLDSLNAYTCVYSILTFHKEVFLGDFQNVRYVVVGIVLNTVRSHVIRHKLVLWMCRVSLETE